MQIKNNILVKVNDDDIPDDGIFIVPENVVEVKKGAFYGCNNLRRVSASQDVKITKHAFLQNSEESDIPSNSSNRSNISINLLWLNKELCPNQRLIFEENLENSKENYDKLLDSAIGWDEGNPNSTVTIWYDSSVTTNEQVLNTEAVLACFPKIELKDLREIPIVAENPNIFSNNTGFYFRIDLLKLIIIHFMLSSGSCDYSVFTDIGVNPMPDEKLLDDATVATIENHGILTNEYENQFIQAENSSEVIKSLALIINANLQRCHEALQWLRADVDNMFYESIMLKLHAGTYYETTHTLHFLCCGFKNGKILINDYKETYDEKENWVEYDPIRHGHMPLGNYHLENGAYNYFKRIDITPENLNGNDFWSSRAKFCRTLCLEGDSPLDLLKFSGMKILQFDDEIHLQPEAEYKLRNFCSGISSYRGSRDDIQVRAGRSHLDIISANLDDGFQDFPLSLLAILEDNSDEHVRLSP